jgi:hypothetical protein
MDYSIHIADYATETTKRGTTHQRRKIIGKATESRKKAKREAKRNPQWKSSKFLSALGNLSI